MTIEYKGIAKRSATNDKGYRSYVDVHTLTTSERSEGAYAVGSDPNLPVIGRSHPDDPFSYCVRLDVENFAPWAGWQVTATYSSEYEVHENPLTEPARVSTTGEKYQEVADRDKDDHAILNSAKDWFTDPPIMRDRTNRIIRVSKNLSAVPSWFLEIDDAVNSEAVTIGGIPLAARQGKIEQVTISELQERNGVAFYTVSFEIHCRKNLWDFRPLQSGYTYLKDGKRVKALLEDGTAPTSPILLDAAGGIIKDPSPSDAQYAQLRVYDEIDFNTYLPLT